MLILGATFFSQETIVTLDGLLISRRTSFLALLPCPNAINTARVLSVSTPSAPLAASASFTVSQQASNPS